MAIDAEHIKSEEQIQKLQNIILLIEKEKDSIGYELHENLCQLLSASMLHIHMAQKNATKKEFIYLEEAGHILQEVLSGLKIIARNISPISLKTLGFVILIDSLSDLIREQKETNCEVRIDENCIKTLSLHFQSILYQIAQLQVINIIKCSNVKNVEISLLPFGNKVKMEIRNDGFCKKNHININSESFKILKDMIEGFGGVFEFSFLEGDMGMIMTIYV